jgi:hypothetical protein
MGTPIVALYQDVSHGTSRPLLLQWRFPSAIRGDCLSRTTSTRHLTPENAALFSFIARDNVVIKEAESPGTSPPKGHCHNGRLERQYTLKSLAFHFWYTCQCCIVWKNVGGLDQVLNHNSCLTVCVLLYPHRPSPSPLSKAPIKDIRKR